ncbi:MAG TPA: SigE family RNA polymerase sigma factor [Ilumatobacteraceae bacterium]|nr:SigE family RNA polymerase sigma factor [Ilumatobacteraceae bacterium]
MPGEMNRPPGGVPTSLADGQADFEAFYRAEYAAAVRLARLLTDSAAAAEDRAQDAFVRMYRHFARVDNPAAFLRTTVVNVCRSWHRSRRRETERLVKLTPVTTEQAPVGRELDAVIAALSYKYRAVLVLRYWLDLSERDIAAALGCRPGTVKSTTSRALAQLRTQLSAKELS